MVFMKVLKSSSCIDSSLHGILRVVGPLVLSSMSSSLMVVIDRLILTYYSVDAMNAAAIGGNFVAIFCFSLACIAGITEVFVGQYNGAKNYKKVANPVWQMIYFVLLTIFVLVPIGIYSDKINLFPECYSNDGIPYQRILVYFCWVPALTAAITGFFVGRGETKIITFIVVIGSLVNAVLDVILVFGYKNIIPRLGCKGAAIATVISEFLQTAILACKFLNKKNRTLYKTDSLPMFDKNLFFRGIKIGLPTAIGRSAEMLAWYLVCSMLGHVSKDLATAYTIGVTIYIMFAFICEGITKGTAAISANFIGCQSLLSIRESFNKLVIIAITLCCVVMLPIVVHPDLLFAVLRNLHDDISNLYPTLRVIFIIQFLNVAIEAVGSVSWGILLSGGDAKYPNVVALGSLWIFVVLPVSILFFANKLNSAIIVQLLAMLYNISWAVLVFFRYKSLKWYKSIIT